ncbi:Transposase, Rhodopirellula-type, partial [mine drainage metagenome]
MQEVTGLSAPTIIKGMQEVRQDNSLSSRERLRRPGAGRPPVERVDAEALPTLRVLVEGTTAGSPMGALLWTHKSTRTLAEEMTRQGHPVSPNTAGRLLETLGYSLQVNAKSKEGRSPPERDAQFRAINRQVAAFQT